jgi:hypothetical protein
VARRRRKPSLGTDDAARSSPPELRGLAWRPNVAQLEAVNAKLPAPTRTAKRNDGTANGFYGNSEDLEGNNKEPKHQGKKDVTGP